MGCCQSRTEETDHQQQSEFYHCSDLEWVIAHKDYNGLRHLLEMGNPGSSYLVTYARIHAGPEFVELLNKYGYFETYQAKRLDPGKYVIIEQP